MEGSQQSVYTQNYQNHAHTILLLIENSQKMLSVWQELKDNYLNPLLGSIGQSSGAVQVRREMPYSRNSHSVRLQPSLFVIESSVDPNIASYSPRQYSSSQSALMSVNFGYGLDGRISPTRVEHCIQVRAFNHFCSYSFSYFLT